MIRQFAYQDQHGFDWVDLQSPTDEEIAEIALKYELHEASIKDAAQPDHLPKHEEFDNYTFVIFRVLSADPVAEADTIRELTNKISVFYSDRFFLTVHRSALPIFETVKSKRIDTRTCSNTTNLLIYFLREALYTFDQRGARLADSLDYYEDAVFLKQRKVPVLRGLYFVKRKIDVIRRLLLLSFELIDNIDAEEKRDVYTRDLRDLYVRTQALFDNLSENTAQLLSAYFSLASQRTNETMRILTVFSVFFMPLTFIVGIYGMNFHFMPELEWYYGYPAVMVLMFGISVGIYFWFKKKGWW